MDHQHAIEAQFPDRYVFRDLSPSDRDSFEEHLADCSRCMEEVRVAQSFAANAHSVFEDLGRAAATPVSAKPSRFGWWMGGRALAFSGGLNLALAGVAAYSFFAVVPMLQSEIRKLEAPSASESFVIQGLTRAAKPTYTVPRGSSANFRLDLPRRFDRYLLIMEGAPERIYHFSAPDAAETLNLTIPVATLAPGDYNVQLDGSQGNESERLASFVLRITR